MVGGSIPFLGSRSALQQLTSQLVASASSLLDQWWVWGTKVSLFYFYFSSYYYSYSWPQPHSQYPHNSRVGWPPSCHLSCFRQPPGWTALWRVCFDQQTGLHNKHTTLWNRQTTNQLVGDTNYVIPCTTVWISLFLGRGILTYVPRNSRPGNCRYFGNAVPLQYSDWLAKFNVLKSYTPIFELLEVKTTHIQSYPHNLVPFGAKTTGGGG